MSRIMQSLVLGSLLAGCVRHSPASSEPSGMQRLDAVSTSTTPELVARQFNLRAVERGFTPPGGDAVASPNGGPGTATPFGLYVLALSWAPNFCCSHPGKGECQGLDGSFGANHLTLHGLWPNYTDAEAQQTGATYPLYCAPYGSCKRTPSPECSPDPSTLPDSMKTYGPGYVSDNNFLANHEWPKHGSCTGLDSRTYFSAALSALKNLPGDQGTPDLLKNNIGGTVLAMDLQKAFGNPESVMLSCDANCNLMQVSICLANGPSGQPAARMACPDNTTNSAYDNGCFVNNCKTVTIQAANQCGAGGP